MGAGDSAGQGCPRLPAVLGEFHGNEEWIRYFCGRFKSERLNSGQGVRELQGRDSRHLHGPLLLRFGSRWS